MFLKKSDLNTKISDKLLTLISEGEDAIIDEALQYAEATLRLYLRAYDMAEIFNKTDGDRNRVLVKWGAALALYELMQRIPDDEIPAKVIKNYNDTMETLEQVARGKIVLSLPLRDTPSSPFRMGYAKKRGNFY